jgi:FtsP/CotA-like multicopper oxidase with cupredoxin domain
MHGHDFFILAQSYGAYDPVKSPASFKTSNPPRRDTATLPGNGYLAIAFQLDNPGAWLTHCHVAWHASQGLSLEFVESQSKIAGTIKDRDGFDRTCKTWDTKKDISKQLDSGI